MSKTPSKTSSNKPSKTPSKIPEVPANVGCCLEVRVLKRKSSSFVKSAAVHCDSGQYLQPD